MNHVDLGFAKLRLKGKYPDYAIEAAADELRQKGYIARCDTWTDLRHENCVQLTAKGRRA